MDADRRHRAVLQNLQKRSFLQPQKSLFSFGHVASGFPIIYVIICASSELAFDVYLREKPSRDVLPNQTVNVIDPFFNLCYVGFQTGMIYRVVVPLALILVISTAIVVKTSPKINAMNKELAKMRPSDQQLLSNHNLASQIKDLVERKRSTMK